MDSRWLPVWTTSRAGSYRVGLLHSPESRRTVSAPGRRCGLMSHGDANEAASQPVMGLQGGLAVRGRIPLRRPLFAKREGWCSCLADAHLRRELLDASLVLPFETELLAGEKPLGAAAGAAGLDVGALSAGLPAAGDGDRALDGGALLAVDVLGVGEPQVLQVLAGQAELAPGAVEPDRQRAVVLVDAGDLAAGFRSRPWAGLRACGWR